jgi:hypothetical protein
MKAIQAPVSRALMFQDPIHESEGMLGSLDSLFYPVLEMKILI